jgi:hypothetical protein
VFRALPRHSLGLAPAGPSIALLTLAIVFAGLLVPTALGADPSPMLIDPLDPRAEGEGPGVVGAPLLAALAVLALGALAALATAVYVRLTHR